MKAEWKIKKLGELCRIRTGKKDVNQGNPDGAYPFFTCAAEHTFSDSYSFNTEALLIAGNGNVGQVSYYNGKFEAYQRTYVLSDFSEIHSRFLFQILDGKLKETVSKQKLGNTMPYIKLGMLSDFLVPIPPLDEQRRIVTVLDEAFADIATAKSNAEKNLQNARSLFESRMQTLFDEDQNWERVQLENLLSRGWITSHLDGNHGSDYPKKEEFVDYGVPYIAARALRGWEVDFSEAKYLTPERAATIRKGLAQDGDVLFAHNATVGPVGVLKTKEPFVILGTSLTYYRCNEDFILPEYLAHYMRSPAFVNQYSQVMKQSTRNQVPITKQREFFHVIPPISIQKKIATDLDSLSEKIELIESIYRQKLTALDALKKSLLHQAFSGQL